MLAAYARQNWSVHWRHGPPTIDDHRDKSLAHPPDADYTPILSLPGPRGQIDKIYPSATIPDERKPVIRQFTEVDADR